MFDTENKLCYHVFNISRKGCDDMDKWRMIGIRVTKESTLPDRLKSLSEKTDLPYGELLERLITQAEQESDSLGLTTKTKESPNLSGDIEALAEKYKELEARLVKLETASAPVAGAKPEPVSVTSAPAISTENPVELLEAPLGARTKKNIAPIGATASQPPESTPRPPEDENTAKLTYLRQLRDEGLSMAAIAKRLTDEGRPTLSGRGDWNPGTVCKLLKQGAK